MQYFKSKFNDIVTKNFLLLEYVKNKKSVCEIAKSLSCNPDVIILRLLRFKIHIRNKSEAKMGKIFGPQSKEHITKRVESNKKRKRLLKTLTSSFFIFQLHN